MNKRTWLKLVRESKNDNTYFQLITCVKGYLKLWNKFSAIDFYSKFTQADIKLWYTDKHIFNHWYNIVYKKV